MAVLRKTLIPVLGAIVISGLAASAAHADGGLLARLTGGSCGTTSSAFAQWQDPRSYYLVNDGGFENGGAGWTFTGGAAVASGNEPFFIHSSSDTSSLSIPSGGTATSPPICFGLLDPGIRMVATGSGTVSVRVIATGLLGSLSVLDGGTATVSSTWAPTPVFATTFSQLNIPVGAKSIQIRISATGSVRIDDIYIDPFESR